MPEVLDGSFELMDGLLYPVYRIALIVAGLAVAVLLYVLVSKTRVGMLVRAGGHQRAPWWRALGVDIRRLFMLVFGFGAMLAGFAGILAAPILVVEPGMGRQPADPCVRRHRHRRHRVDPRRLPGGPSSSALSTRWDAGFATDIAKLALSPSAANDVGPAIASMLIYVLMAAVLFFRPLGAVPGAWAGEAAMTTIPPRKLLPRRPRRRPLRPRPGWRRLPWAASRRWTRETLIALTAFALFALLPVLAAGLEDTFMVFFAIRVMVFAIAAVSLSLILGFGALVSFGHAAYLGLGAYSVAILAEHGYWGRDDIAAGDVARLRPFRRGSPARSA